ncbi:unnamed protein product [Owenia fusiformis]|uniref:Afadin n=1 Tax=Owenia fusiformis TaxID=6347 RepID=A0A8S4Q5X2_OWEFU|nr:unnamed protein product [Owenia fusiformis]
MSKDSGVGEQLYNELPETSFTRTISNPESVMRRRRQMKLEKKLQEIKSKNGPDSGGTLKIYGESIDTKVPYKTLLLSSADEASSVVKETLDKYGMEKEDPLSFCLVQMIVPHQSSPEYKGPGQGKEIMLEDDECPLAILMQHSPNEGSVMFHLRRRPEGMPKRKKKSPNQVNSQSSLPPGPESRAQVPLEILPYLLELDQEGRDLPRAQRFYIHYQVTEVGSERSMTNNQQYLQLMGPGISPVHCVITYTDGIVTVTPTSPDAITYVDNRPVNMTTMLQHGMVVRFGQAVCFRYCDPDETPKRSPGGGGDPNVQKAGPYGPDDQAIFETTFDMAGDIQTEVSPGPDGGRGGVHFPPDLTLPATLEFQEQGEDAFLAAIITEVNPGAVQFKLAPTYTLYMATRYRVARTQRANMSPSERNHRIMSLVNKIASMIRQTIQENRNSAPVLAFWMANASELLHFYKMDRDISQYSIEAQDLLAEAVQITFRHLVHCMQNELRKVMPGFIQDHDEDLIEDENQRNPNFNPPRPDMEDVLQNLSAAMSLLRRCRVNAALTIQLFSQLFHYVNMWLFNQLVGDPRSGLCNRVCGRRLKLRLSRVEIWAEKQGLELAADCHLARIVQAAVLLQTPKLNRDDTAYISKTCFKLNSIQIRTLLENYQPLQGEPPVPPEMVYQLIQVAEATADATTMAEGKQVQLEEEPDLQLPFLLPEDGYSCDIVEGVPTGLGEFIDPLSHTGICRVTMHPDSPQLWTIYMVGQEPTNLSTENVQRTSPRPAPGPGGDAPPQGLPKEPEVMTVTFAKVNGSMGLSIVAARGDRQEEKGIYIKSVVKEGAADLDKRLQAGDQLLEVDGKNLIGKTQEKAAELMTKTGHNVTLKVAKQAAIYQGLATLLSQPSPVMSRGSKSQEQIRSTSTSNLRDQRDPREAPHNPYARQHGPPQPMVDPREIAMRSKSTSNLDQREPGRIENQPIRDNRQVMSSSTLPRNYQTRNQENPKSISQPNLHPDQDMRNNYENYHPGGGGAPPPNRYPGGPQNNLPPGEPVPPYMQKETVTTTTVRSVNGNEPPRDRDREGGFGPPGARGYEHDIPRQAQNNQHTQQNFYNNTVPLPANTQPQFERMQRPAEPTKPQVSQKPQIAPKPDGPQVVHQEIPRVSSDPRKTQPQFFEDPRDHDPHYQNVQQAKLQGKVITETRTVQFQDRKPSPQRIDDIRRQTPDRRSESPNLPPPPEIPPPPADLDGYVDDLPPPPPPQDGGSPYDQQRRFEMEQRRHQEQQRDRMASYGGDHRRPEPHGYQPPPSAPPGGPHGRQHPEPMRPIESQQPLSRGPPTVPPSGPRADKDVIRDINEINKLEKDSMGSWNPNAVAGPGGQGPSLQVRMLAEAMRTGAPPPSPSPWEKEEKERKEKKVATEMGQMRDEEIGFLASKQFRTPDEEARLQKLRLDQEFQRRLDESKNDDDEEGDSDSELTDRASGRRELLRRMQEDLAQRRKKSEEDEQQRRIDDFKAEQEKTERQNRRLEQFEKQREQEKQKMAAKQEKKEREHEEFLRKQREMREKQRREAEEHKKQQQQEEERIRQRKMEEIRKKKDLEREQLREMQLAREAEERQLRDQARRQEEEYTREKLLLSTQTRENRMNEDMRRIEKYGHYEVQDQGNRPPQARSPNYAGPKATLNAPPPPERKSSYEYTNPMNMSQSQQPAPQQPSGSQSMPYAYVPPHSGGPGPATSQPAYSSLPASSYGPTGSYAPQGQQRAQSQYSSSGSNEPQTTKYYGNYPPHPPQSGAHPAPQPHPYNPNSQLYTQPTSQPQAYQPQGYNPPQTPTSSHYDPSQQQRGPGRRPEPQQPPREPPTAATKKSVSFDSRPPMDMVENRGPQGQMGDNRGPQRQIMDNRGQQPQGQMMDNRGGPPSGYPYQQQAYHPAGGYKEDTPPPPLPTSPPPNDTDPRGYGAENMPPRTPENNNDAKYETGPTPSIIGAQEVYRDPRQRLLAAKQQNPRNPGQDKMSFRDKMKMFATEAGEDGTPREKSKVSSKQRSIETSINGQR